MVPGGQQLLINVPYTMVRKNMERLVSHHVGVEIYLNNQAVNTVDTGDARSLGRELEERGIVCTLHAPFMDLSPGGFDRDIRALSREKLKKSVEIAHLVGAGGVVCHPGYDKWRFGNNEQLWLDGSIETWTEILKESGELPIMVENIFEETPSTIIALLDYFSEKNLWFCFDTGHFNLFTTLPLDEWLKPLRKRLKELHIHDNHGTSDEHLPIGKGTFPFRDLKHFLKSTDNLLFTAETPDEKSAPECIQRAREFLS
jgi:sugar phosphate isomerase/epimerase